MHTSHLGYAFFTYWGQIFHQKNYYYYFQSKMSKQKFPEDIECIIQPIDGKGGIYISNIEAAQNPLTLKRLNIEAVITAIKGKNLDKVIPRHIQYLYIPAVDHESFDLSYYFEDSNEFIKEEIKRTNVLVHCMAGISRSVTLVIAYLIKHHRKSFLQAYSFVKSRRKIIHPNNQFINQLKQYQNKLKMPLAQKNVKIPQIDEAKKIEKVKSLDRSVGKIRYTHEPKQGKQNWKGQNYDQSLKQSIRLIFKQKQGIKNMTRMLV